MCSISCLLLVVVAIFMIVFHTQWIDNLLGKCGIKQSTTSTTTSKSPTTTTTGGKTTTTTTTPTTSGGPTGGRLRSGDLDGFAIDILSDQESSREKYREQLREIHDDQKIAVTTEINSKSVDGAYFKPLQETTASPNIDARTHNFNDVKELVKEKQSMTKVLSLLEEILKNMNSKKKSRNTRLSKFLNTDTYFDSEVYQ